MVFTLDYSRKNFLYNWWIIQMIEFESVLSDLDESLITMNAIEIENEEVEYYIKGKKSHRTLWL